MYVTENIPLENCLTRYYNVINMAIRHVPIKKERTRYWAWSDNICRLLKFFLKYTVLSVPKHL
jgi:hypothetical protein